MSVSARGADRFAAAHAELRGDSAIQFTLSPAPPGPETPSWLKSLLQWIGEIMEPVSRFFAWLESFFPDAPYARVLLWMVLALTAAMLGWLLYRKLRGLPWRRARTLAAGTGDLAQDDAMPDEAQLQGWLDQADALAAQGQYAEAVHHLLFHSIEDVRRRRPGLVRPSLTSREIAAAGAIPAPARSLFTSIAAAVERSLFAGRPFGEADWSTAREAYVGFARPQAWRA